MTDYHGNSHKEKEAAANKPEKNIQRIVPAGEVKFQKKSVGRKFRDLIIEADMSSVGRFVWFEILIPTVKNLIVDTVEQGVRRTVYGDRRAGYRPPSGPMGMGMMGRSSYYTNYSQPPPSVPYRPDPRGMPQLPGQQQVMQTAVDSRGYIIPTRDYAEETLQTMATIIDQWEVVTVSDLHEMLGLPTNPVETRWGWVDLSGAQIRQIREGWLLELPTQISLP